MDVTTAITYVDHAEAKSHYDFIKDNVTSDSNKSMAPRPNGGLSDDDVNMCIMFDFLIEGVCMGLCVLFGFIGNTLSILCLRREKSKTATPFLLISLEVADTLFLVTVLILRVFTSFETYTNWFSTLMPFFPYIGTFLWPVALIAETASIYLTILVTMNRYVSVCKPYEASNFCSVAVAKKQVVVLSVLSIIYNIPRFFEYTIVSETTHTNETYIKAQMSMMGHSRPYQIVYSNVLYTLVMFAVPLVTLIFLNCKLIKALRKAKQNKAKLLSRGSDSKGEDDITLMLIFVVVFFLICQTPALITQVLLSALDEAARGCPLTLFFYERVSDLMVVANSGMNFIVYCFCSRRFRRILVDLCCARCGVRRRDSVVAMARPSSCHPANPTRDTQL